MTEHVDPLTGATPAWDAFVQSLDPTQIRQACSPKPAPSERPGSAAWRRMVATHQERREAYWARHPPPWAPARQISDADLRAVLAESSGYDRYPRAFTPTQIEIAERALRTTEGNATA